MKSLFTKLSAGYLLFTLLASTALASPDPTGSNPAQPLPDFSQLTFHPLTEFDKSSWDLGRELPLETLQTLKWNDTTRSVFALQLPEFSQRLALTWRDRLKNHTLSISQLLLLDEHFLPVKPVTSERDLDLYWKTHDTDLDIPKGARYLIARVQQENNQLPDRELCWAWPLLLPIPIPYYQAVNFTRDYQHNPMVIEQSVEARSSGLMLIGEYETSNQLLSNTDQGNSTTNTPSSFSLLLSYDLDISPNWFLRSQLGQRISAISDGDQRGQLLRIGLGRHLTDTLLMAASLHIDHNRQHRDLTSQALNGRPEYSTSAGIHIDLGYDIGRYTHLNLGATHIQLEDQYGQTRDANSLTLGIGFRDGVGVGVGLGLALATLLSY